MDKLQKVGIVHSDIKPDNILIKMEPRSAKIESLKLVDFGSSFTFDSMKVTGATPEYLAPEVIQYLKGTKQEF